MSPWTLAAGRRGDVLALTLSGRLEASDRSALEATCAGLSVESHAAVEVQLADLEPPSGGGLAVLVDALRALAGRVERVELHDAPQMLAHTLYKTGLLRGGRLHLISSADPEQPYPG